MTKIIVARTASTFLTCYTSLQRDSPLSTKLRCSIFSLPDLLPVTEKYLDDPIFDELLIPFHNSSKRASWDFYAMIKCGTGCNPLVYKGYGCYCGFLGSGDTVDGLDACCKTHDWCYSSTSCNALKANLPYFVPYRWKCNRGSPYCLSANECSHQLCECDRQFVQCLSRYPCPTHKAMCRSPWRYFQNLFMDLGTGMVSLFR